ncbi:Mov34/MPN/PAD-1 family protein [Edaphobacter modestus]|uniref:Proteasome lid subunit RPN8/RPN11 n=1 Tax=Edaphobacter modestus TaxID=388466 RepID=A0A4Q7XZC9_9BACT|nr:Mov34/MPN/PAD-1 family protein [Edaphobacter modestus]RZU29750.1 proteasome lid subunit RPN8/RPN11 [Edaphobacter modestus]
MSDKPERDAIQWRELPGFSSAATDLPSVPIVKVAQAVLRSVQDHLNGDITIERMGLLLGYVEQQVGAPLIVNILASHPLHSLSASSTHVAMLRDQWPSAWRHFTPVKPDIQLLGWYHSHPGHGIFLSTTDLNTQALWFRQQWHVALVYDPISSTLGAFCGPQGCRTPILATDSNDR